LYRDFPLSLVSIFHICEIKKKLKRGPTLLSFIINRQTIPPSIMTSNMTQISSVFLPRVSAYHDKAYIESVFWTVFQTEESPIHHIDLIMKEDTKKPNCFYHIAFVFFKPLPTTDIIAQFAAEIESGKRVKMVHSDPWYWNMNKNTRPKQIRKPARILSEADEAEIKEAQKALLNARPTDEPTTIVA
jgi:hypothetical protein